MSNYAQETLLKLKTKISQTGKCILEDAFFTPPLKLISPFYGRDENNGYAEIMLISVSAGLMKGDSQKIDIELNKGCKVKLTSQSFEKIHNTQEGYAKKNTRILLGENTLLDFSPLPIIPFAHSHFKGEATIALEINSELFYSEIICAGRVSRNEIFAFKNFTSILKIYRKNKAIFFDNTILEPSKLDLSNICMFSGFSHYLNLIIFTPKISLEFLHKISKKFTANVGEIGVSQLAYDGFCVKALSNSAEALLELREKIVKTNTCL